ncbi:15783_t:CDS:1, partial [Acaulospora morrowiae]
LHIYTLGKCMWNDIEGGKEVIKEAVEILNISKKLIEITHGEGNMVLENVKGLLEMAEKECERE